MESLLLALAATSGISVATIWSVVVLGALGFVNPLVARKLMHIGTGPAYLICWHLFPESPYSPFAVSLVPLALTLYFGCVGLGLFQDGHLVKVVSRNGKRSQLLSGPIMYGIVITVAPWLFWRDTPTGVVGIMVLCVGDGVADLFGRRFGGSNRIPWNKDKSWAGSTAFWVASFVSCLLIGQVFSIWGYMGGVGLGSYVQGCLVLVTASMLVETLPIKEADNLTIGTTCAVLGRLVWPM